MRMFFYAAGGGPFGKARGINQNDFGGDVRSHDLTPEKWTG
jgi:hypothetical protein